MTSNINQRLEYYATLIMNEPPVINIVDINAPLFENVPLTITKYENTVIFHGTYLFNKRKQLKLTLSQLRAKLLERNYYISLDDLTLLEQSDILERTVYEALVNHLVNILDLDKAKLITIKTNKISYLNPFRIIAFRKSLRMSKTTFAKHIGISYYKLSQIESEKIHIRYDDKYYKHLVDLLNS